MFCTLGSSLGGLYASVYWCLFPPSAQEKVIPRLQDCQDSLQDRHFKLKQREIELRAEINVVKKHRDRTRLRRVFLELKSTLKDIAVTENTLWTVDRQLQLFERSDLDSLIIGTLQSSTAALNGMSKNLPGVENVDELTETLQNRMQEVNEMTETVSSALQRGLDDDYSTLEKELDEFLTAELDTHVPLTEGLDTHAPVPPQAEPTTPHAHPTREPARAGDAGHGSPAAQAYLDRAQSDPSQEGALRRSRLDDRADVEPPAPLLAL